jgi:hypothetical protein
VRLDDLDEPVGGDVEDRCARPVVGRKTWFLHLDSGVLIPASASRLDQTLGPVRR